MAALLCLLGGLLADPAFATPTWTAPVELSAAAAVRPQVALDSSGDAVAVWERWNGTHFVIEAASKPAGGAWTAPVEISVASQSAFEPQVALDSSGDAIAVWYRYNGSNDIVQAASKPAAGAWTAPANLSEAGEEARDPQVAVDSGDDAAAVWMRSNGSNEIVQAASKPAGGAWGASVNLSAAGKDAEEPQVALDSGGDAVAVWSGEGETIIQAASKPAAGAWTASVNVSAPGTAVYEPQIALDSAGDAVAVWKRDDLITYEIQAASKPAGGAWGAPGNLAVATAGEEAEAPQIALDSAGDATAVWLRYNGSNRIVQAASKPAGGAWGASIELSALGQNAFEPGVALDSGGDAVSVWQRWNGSDYVVQAASKPAAGAWAGAVDLSTGGPSPFVNPQVALDSGGDAVAVWTNAGEIVEAAELDQRFLTVTKTGSGAVTSSPAGINCGSECSAPFAPGAEVTLSAAPGAGSEFKGWSGACSGAAACKVTMSAAKSVSVEFAAILVPPQFAPPVPPSVPPQVKKSKSAVKLKAALQKCRKLKGKAKPKCIKKARVRFKHS